MTRRNAVATLLVSLVAGLTVACSSSGSSSGGSSPSAGSSTAWANGVCTALGSWQSSVRSATSSVTGGNLSKNSLQAAATSLSSANDKLQSDLKAQGTPNTSAGKAAKQSIDKLSTTVKDGADSIKSAVSDSSGIAGLRAAATAIGSALASMKNQFTATYDSLRGAKGDLHDAFQNAPACQQLSASSHSS